MSNSISGRILVYNYCSKCSSSIRLLDSWKSNISIMSYVMYPNFLKTISNISRRQYQVSFVYWTPVNRGSPETTVVCLKLSASVDQLTAFLRSDLLLFFSDFLIKLHYFNIQELIDPNIFRKLIFAYIWTKNSSK